MSCELEIPIRWRDNDAYGHVNNAVYLTYLEECRDRLVSELFGAHGWDFVLAHVGIDYRHQLTQADDLVRVRCAVASFSTSSVLTTERITMIDGTLAAEAESVIVPRDASAQASRPLTEAECATLQAAIDADAR